MPESVKKSERFEIPKVSGHIEGNKTIISNFSVIAQTLERDVSVLQKFVLKELATPGNLRNGELILGRKVSPVLINEKITKFADMYVFCPECNKPDTDLITIDGALTKKCKACGHQITVKPLS